MKTSHIYQSSEGNLKRMNCTFLQTNYCADRSRLTFIKEKQMAIVTMKNAPTFGVVHFVEHKKYSIVIQYR